MKKVLFYFGLILSLSLFCTTKTHAVYDLSLTAPTAVTLTSVLTGAKGSTSSFTIVVSKTPPPTTYTSPTYNAGPLDSALTLKPNTNGTITWTTVVDPETLYYVRIVEIPYNPPPALQKKSFYTTNQKSIITPPATIIPGNLVFNYDQSVGSVFIRGTIDTVKNPAYKNYSIQIQYSKNPIITGDRTFSVYKFDAIKEKEEAGIAEDGTYHLFIPRDITSNVQYFFRQTITYGGTKKVTDGVFKSDSGFILSTDQTAIQDDFESRSYRLLAPLPGFTLFLDPDLCAEQVEQGKKGQLCDINDMLNLGFQILIGLAAVLLVLRIMFEGYTYITTDIPKLKINAKAGLMDAVLGLLLALSAFLILNTINPKLVENSIDVGALQIGVEFEGDTSGPTIFAGIGSLPTAIYCPRSGKSSSITKIAQSFKGNVTYQTPNGKNSAKQSDGTAHLDCSGWVTTVLSCAGYTAGADFINSGTADIFRGAEQLIMSSGYVIKGSDVIINNKKLNPGDQIGWVATAGKPGHVLLYVGNTTFMDTHGGKSGRQTGNAIGTYSAQQLKDLYSTKIKYVKRIPL